MGQTSLRSSVVLLLPGRASRTSTTSTTIATGSPSHYVTVTRTLSETRSSLSTGYNCTGYAYRIPGYGNRRARSSLAVALAVALSQFAEVPLPTPYPGTFKVS
eukprot:622679-Rhodomonas_salina.2